jgi:4-amino-4-deoxy-L-arabinose transferase-like glycosyltransferase
MIETQPGEARNDIMGLAFLLAFAAFLINGHQRRAPASGAVQDAPESDAPLLDKGPLVMAGIAAGLAASVKFTFLVPVVAITLGVVLFSGRGRRWTTAWVMGIPMLVVGGYWYLRAAIKTGGNPIPITKFGPLNLPKPDQMPLDPRPRFAVADYITDPTIYRRWFFPELDNALGPLWPLILIVAVSAAAYVAWRSRNKILRVIALASLLTAVVYVFTPLTAAGQEGSPTGFFTNTRYLIPGLVLALAMLPIARPLRAPDKRAWQTLLFLTGLYAITVLTTPRWFTSYLVGAVFLTLCLVWAPAGLSLARTRAGASRGAVAVAAVVVVLLAVVLGRAQQVQYAEQHYVNPDPFLAEGGPKEAYEFTQQLQDQRIGIIGSSQIIFGQYGFYGNDASNHVEFIGVKGPHGANRLPTTCQALRGLINEGGYDYLVMSQYTQDTGPYNAGVPNPYQFPVFAWVKNDPAVKLVVKDFAASPQADYVFKVNGKLDPSACEPEKRPEVPGETAPE